MLAAVAFCPHPPVLVPALAGGAAAELDELRTACDLAIRRLLAAGPRRLYVLGSGVRPALHGPDERGSLAAYGMDVVTGLGHAPAAGAHVPPAPAGHADHALPLPLPLAVGGWLLGRAGAHPPACGVQVGAAGELPPLRPDAAAGLLVMGDASARRTAAAPGALDSRAVPFDETVAAALRSGDPAALRSVDLTLGAALLAAGVPAWLAAGRLLSGARYHAELLYAGAPYGVGYFVASWIRDVPDTPASGAADARGAEAGGAAVRGSVVDDGRRRAPRDGSAGAGP